jgi:hypothetical protein
VEYCDNENYRCSPVICGWLPRLKQINFKKPFNFQLYGIVSRGELDWLFRYLYKYAVTNEYTVTLSPEKKIFWDEYYFTGLYQQPPVIAIPEGIECIREHSLSGLAVVRLELPASLHFIEAKAFSNKGIQTKIQSCTISPRNPYYCMENGFLLTKDRSEAVCCIVQERDCIEIPEGVRKIGQYACADIITDKIKHITIPSSLEEIDCNAFENMYAWFSFTAPSSLKKIRMSAFSGNKADFIGFVPPCVKTIECGAFDQKKFSRFQGYTAYFPKGGVSADGCRNSSALLTTIQQFFRYYLPERYSQWKQMRIESFFCVYRFICMQRSSDNKSTVQELFRVFSDEYPGCYEDIRTYQNITCFYPAEFPEKQMQELWKDEFDIYLKNAVPVHAESLPGKNASDRLKTVFSVYTAGSLSRQNKLLNIRQTKNHRCNETTFEYPVFIRNKQNVIFTPHEDGSITMWYRLFFQRYDFTAEQIPLIPSFMEQWRGRYVEDYRKVGHYGKIAEKLKSMQDAMDRAQGL